VRDVCVLELRADVDDEITTSAAAAIVFGLIELCELDPLGIGDVIAAMEGLLASGLRSNVDRQTELGLAGEILLVASSAAPSVLIDAWHSDFDDRFDFSIEGGRLEVKTTAGGSRIHWFSSGQLGHIPGVTTCIASILMPIVEIGSTIASMFASIGNVDAERHQKIRSIITKATGTPPEMLNGLVFDRVAAEKSIRHFHVDDIPSPSWGQRVLKIRWQAELDESPTPVPKGCVFAAALTHGGTPDGSRV
jgi:hypothetical protein